jgi:hypothetical protein
MSASISSVLIQATAIQTGKLTTKSRYPLRIEAKNCRKISLQSGAKRSRWSSLDIHQQMEVK